MSVSEDALVEQSVEVVLLRAAEHDGVIPVGGDVSVVLTASEPVDSATVAALRDAVVQLDSPSDLPADVLQAVIDSPTPVLFQGSPWLRGYKALVLTDGHCTVAGHVLCYRGSLVLEPDEPVAQPRADQHLSFDLRQEPWIPVVDLEGQASTVSLERLILEAHLFRRIAAEAPTMTAALYRLVLALAHRVYGPASEQAWTDLWSAKEFPRDRLRTYMDDFADRFDLFHPRRPFLQCVELGSLPPASPGKLVPYRAVGNNVTLFDHTTSTDQIVLSAAEAARWLVTTQAFDPGGMKTPYEKDKSSERAPCNLLGVVVVEGANLKETLLLNMVVYEPDYEKPRMTTPGDRPEWEDPSGPSPLPSAPRTARGWTDLLTWPSRRILLSVNDQKAVSGVVVTPGTRLNAYLPDEEKMVAFRRPRDGKGTIKRDAPMLPVRLHPVRGIWRHSVELLMTDLWTEDRNRQRPPALDQIADLANRGRIPPGTVYTLRVFGQQLDSKASVVEAWMEEEVPAPVALLRARDESVGALIGGAITLADEAGSALRALQANYRRELRATPASDIDLPYWPRLSRPFNAFLVRLGEALINLTSEAPTAHKWIRDVTAIAKSVADRWVAGSPAEASKLLVLGKHLGQFHKRMAIAALKFQSDIAIYTTRGEDTGE
ncbi:type I-E CRISPR-associated protein Cse1/CasA [Actinocrispum wychmicini]|uniref:CRISPR system Cascade subunit CasA n=1 Tax=Actinocrispum wychmicini TaxID=1213861 RepID=A0A4R2JTC4_9PSEU|nr:type I-E CRISPR-associated protein Cse1/CasA [Actinocrispum wychmicini]TCO62884.1 CRISPR system Cascade subunit CasA [Actinocrispum wychmicini]